MTQELATQDLPLTIDTDRPMTVREMTEQSMVIHRILTEVMVEGIHYGSIPGTGDKKTLLQPGAEKICTTFRLAPKQQVDDLCEPHNNLYRYRVTCSLYTIRDGLFVGAAVGEASSAEEKYSWQAAICQEQWDEEDTTRRRKKYVKDGDGFKVILQVARNAADLANTVLKMAVKRAFLSVTRGATAASDLLEVDLDDDVVADLARQERGAQEQPKAKTKAKQPPAPVVPYGEPHKGKRITDDTIPLNFLLHMAQNMTENLDDPKRAKFKNQNQVFLAALNAEILARKAAASAAGTAQGQGQEKPSVNPSDRTSWAASVLEWETDHAAEYVEAKKAFKVASAHDLPPEKLADFTETMRMLITTK